ncbi:hypothetical protein BV20DRAFT_970278 [Pilatotrama ljubarskyi]|nr:hypothetical protein BV20DRAFT_970278 [Pilatotrama ljubarskyi]
MDRRGGTRNLVNERRPVQLHFKKGAWIVNTAPREVTDSQKPHRRHSLPSRPCCYR